ncbi:MAG: glycosyltransferase [Bacteroidales bacterium]|nr:glycosyltransferase [Bacteroidales bacterium]
MTLSIVIVNYNVRHYLEQCLTSVFAAAEGIETEVFVVDNNSVDDSVQMLRQCFPQVHLIANSDNPGFAKANNQALRQCTGEYILLLNPDTIVQRDTFSTCISFIEQTADCGGVGVRMVNGEGEFLKESKRGFPSPKTSFYKISGLIRLLPHHPKVGAYYMGNLSDSEIQKIDVLPGAFIMMRRKAFEKVGMLDESYFMYGEDIDFSWRFKLAGFDNYYLPTTRILHYKGESTKHGSINYVYTFYNAMSIFVKRYFAGGDARLYNSLIRIAIWLRALLAVIKRSAQRVALPLADLLISYSAFFATKIVWANYWAENVNYYPDSYTWGVLPLYSFIILVCTWIAGGYDKPVKLSRIARGIAIGALSLLVFYSLLDETMRFSRAILIIGSLTTLIASLLIRLILGWFGVEGYRQGPPRKRSYLVVADDEEYERILQLFDQLGITPRSVVQQKADKVGTLCHKDCFGHHRPDEIIFCTKDVAVASMLDVMEALRSQKIDFRTAPDYGSLLIGGSYIFTTDQIYKTDDQGLATPRYRRIKRIFDILSATLVLILSPLLFWLQRRKRRFFSDCFSVFQGRRTWVGYSQPNVATPSTQPLPHLKPSVFRTCDRIPLVRRPDTTRLDQQYAQHYTPLTDLTILLKNWHRI